MDIDLDHLPEDAQALKALVRTLVGDVKAKALKIVQLEARSARAQAAAVRPILGEAQARDRAIGTRAR
jgi:hypothetical protein